MYARTDELSAARPAHGVVAGWLRRAAQANANRRAAARLATMDEHMLRDIGVTRVQAERLALGLDD